MSLDVFIGLFTVLAFVGLWVAATRLILREYRRAEHWKAEYWKSYRLQRAQLLQLERLERLRRPWSGGGPT